jgi:hypothetical protein
VSHDHHICALVNNALTSLRTMLAIDATVRNADVDVNADDDAPEDDDDDDKIIGNAATIDSHIDTSSPRTG